MCIAILSTAHPEYAAVIIDNRDEFILRPTSRPHWWTHPVSGEQVLSSRDLQREEQGTWLAINKVGHFAILTNYREDVDLSMPICATRSRGGMPIAWIGGLANDGVMEGVQQLVKDGGVKGVGGFSMICGRLRKDPENIAIVSNRVDSADEVPLIGKERGKTWGLSNTTFNPQKWPKVAEGEAMVEKAIEAAMSEKLSEKDFVESLFMLLDRDTLSRLPRGSPIQDYMRMFKTSIFIPPVGTKEQEVEFAESAAQGRGDWSQAPATNSAAGQAQVGAGEGYSKGLYGTQRQTVVLVDWNGNVTYVERALWDPNGNRIERGRADVTVRFQIEGWGN